MAYSTKLMVEIYGGGLWICLPTTVEILPSNSNHHKLTTPPKFEKDLKILQDNLSMLPLVCQTCQITVIIDFGYHRSFKILLPILVVLFLIHQKAQNRQVSSWRAKECKQDKMQTSSLTMGLAASSMLFYQDVTWWFSWYQLTWFAAVRIPTGRPGCGITYE